MTVRVGFVGTGGIAHLHMAHLKQIEEAEVVAMYDVAVGRAQAAAASFPGCKAYDSYQQMLDQAELNALWVCLPPFAHEQQEIQAAAAGINLFIEKPIAITIEKALEIDEAIANSGIISAVGYNWRWLDTTDRVLDVLQDSPIALALGFWLGGMPGVPWWRRKDQSGGQIVEQTTHIFDLARYYLGEVKQVYAVGFQGQMQDIENYDTEDASTVILEFESGPIANISSTDLLPSGAGKIGLELIARDLRIEQSSHSVTFYRRGERTTHDAQVDPYFREDEAFIDAVARGDGSALRCRYADALRTHLVTMAANRSLASGKPESVGQPRPVC